MRDGHGRPRVPRTRLTARGQLQSGVACDAQRRRREEAVSQVRREADASCVARVVPSAVPSDASRVRPMARDRATGATAFGSASASGVLTRLGPTAAGVVVRLVLLLNGGYCSDPRPRGGAKRAHARRDHSVTFRPVERKPDRVAESSSVTGEIQGSTAENARVCWAECPVGVAETPSVQGGVSAIPAGFRFRASIGSTFT